MTTGDDALLALMARGFVARKGPGDGRVPYTLVVTFAWAAPYLDAVHLRGEQDTTAVRARIDGGRDLAWLFAEDTDDEVTNGEDWFRGEFVPVVSRLLALDPPGDPGPPAGLVMTPGGLWVPSDRVNARQE